MIKVNNRNDVKSLLLKRSKLQEQYIKACAKTAEDHESNHIRHYKKDYNLLTIWYFLLLGYIVLLLLYYLSDTKDNAIWITVISIIGASMLGFLTYILFRIKNTKKLKRAWDVDLHQANLIRDEANKYGEKAAKLGIMIMAITEHNYLLDILDCEQEIQWRKLLYEYVDAINEYYKGATIDDYIEFYKVWETKYY